MWMIKLAWKNLWRNRSRTLITVAAIFFAVVLSILTNSLQQGVFDNLVKNVVGFYTGYLQVHRTGYQDEQTLENSFENAALLQEKIRTQANVTGLTPRIEAFALAATNEVTTGCMVVGIAPEEENRITHLKDKIIQGNYLQSGNNTVLLSAGLAERLKLKVGDTIVLIGQGYHGATAAGKYRVGGLLQFGSPQLNSRMLFMPLQTAQEFLSADGLLTSYVLTIRNEKALQPTAIALRQNLGSSYELYTWEQLLPDVRQHITADTNNMKVIQGVLYLLISFGTFSTLLMMMAERRYELGMLEAIGMQKSRIAVQLAVESILTVTIGCVAGMLASVPLVYYLHNHPLRIGGETAKAYQKFGFEPVFPAATDSSIFLNQGVVVLVIGLVLALYPSLKIIRQKPVTAMRR